MQKMQCRACEGLLRMDAIRDVAVCDYCDMEFDKKGVEIGVEGIHGLKALAKNAEIFFEMGEHAKARKIFIEISEKYPGSSVGWWGLLRCETADFLPTHNYNSIYYERALQFASRAEKTEMIVTFEKYLSKRNLLLREQKEQQDEHMREQKEQQDEHNRRKGNFDAANQKLDAKKKELSNIRKGGGLGAGILVISGIIILFMLMFAGGSDAVVVPFFGIIIGVVIIVIEKGRKSIKIAQLQKEVQELQNNVSELSE